MPSPHRRDNIKKKSGRLECIPCFLEGTKTRYDGIDKICPVSSGSNDKPPGKADTVVKV